MEQTHELVSAGGKLGRVGGKILIHVECSCGAKWVVNPESTDFAHLPKEEDDEYPDTDACIDESMEWHRRSANKAARGPD